jgi:Transposase DDE domain
MYWQEARMNPSVPSLLNQLPLAEASWLLWHEVLPEQVLQDIYDSYRGASYERCFSFSQLVHLLNDALTRHQGHAQKTLDQHADSQQCPASEPAFYGKLRRMPIPLSEGFLADGSLRLRSWLPEQPHRQLPASLQAFRVLLFDGKTFKHAAKRLKPLQQRAGRALGGKALVAFEPATGLIVGMAACPDGHTNEAKLVPQLLPQVRQRLPGPRLWVGDQGFGDLAQVRRCTEEGDHCVLRLHPKSQFTPDPLQPARRGVDAQGRAWTDAIGQLHSTREGSKTMRRITLVRPGKKDLVLITDLLDAEAYPANDLLELYRVRWGIETVFLTVSEVFHLKHLIGSHPRGIIFQASLCMMYYNVVQVLRGLVAQTQERATQEVSTHNLFTDLQHDLIALYRLAKPDDLVAGLRERAASIADLRAYVLERLGRAWSPWWVKARPKKRHLPKPKHKRGGAAHFSSHRVLEEYKKTQREQKAKDV